MASGGKTPVTTASGEDQGRGGTVRPRSKSPTKRPTSPPNQPRSPRASLKATDSATTSLRAPQPQTVHQSNSVPATPSVHARRYSNDHRTPSPINGVKHDGSTSPRSVRSDSDSRARPSGRALFQQGGCKFETGMAFSRRRIPYTIGGDPLEKATEPIKERLSKEEDETLTAETQNLYERLLPTPESEERRAKFKAKLENILNEQWPGNDIKVHVFGSSGNLLCTTESDVDICISCPPNVIGKVCNLAQCLSNKGMQRIVCIPQAKVPIVKIWDSEYRLACDMNVNNMDAIENTRLIRTYVQIDPRVRPLAMVVKHWTRRRILNDAGMGGTLSSYTWISLLIHYLQSRQPPILPSLQRRPHQCTLHADGKRSTFADDIEALSKFGKPNQETVGDLLFGFFRYYGHEFDYENSVISIREGKLLSKSDKRWPPSVNNRLCVEEPFNTDRNLGNTVDDYAFRGVHLEIRRAYELLCEAKLEECCEQYEWPAVEATQFWQKPTPQPLPILSRSRSQTNRSSRSSETSGRNQGKPRHRTGGGSGRRASSAAASNKNNALFPNGPGNQVWNGDRNNSMTIHETLSQQMHILQQQEAYFKLQMQQSVMAHSHAQTVAQLPNLGGSASPRHVQSLRESRRGSHVDNGPLSAPLRGLQTLQNAYFSGASSNARSGSVTPGLGHNRLAGTNPSSPSIPGIGRLAPMDLRIQNQRPLTPESADMARSRSQPPSSKRTNPGQQQQHAHEKHGNALAGYPGLQQYQQHWMQAQAQAQAQAKRHGLKQSSQGSVSSPRLDSMHLDGHASEDHIPAEYMGYYTDHLGQRQLAPHMHPGAFDRQDRTYSPDSHRVKNRNSRSPSPSAGSFRDRSYSVQSARPAQQQQTPASRAFGSLPTSLSTPVMGSGPIIIDGSGDSPEANPPSRPSSFYESTASDATAMADEPALESATSGSDPFVAHEEHAPPVEDDIAVVAGPSRGTVQFGDHEPRALRSFKERRAPSQSSQSSSGWYDPALASGLGIDVEPALAAAKDEQAQAAQQTQQTSNPQHLPSHVANGISKGTLSNLKQPPLLSPVREVRTPSPTTSRTNSANPVLSQGRAHHGRAVSLLSGQAAIAKQQQQQQQQQAALEGSRPSVVESGFKTVSPKLTGQPFSVVAAQSGNGGQSSSRASPLSEISRTTTPRIDTNGPAGQNGSTRPEPTSAKPRQGSAPSSISMAPGDGAGQGQSGWQQATKRNKKKNKGKNNSISIPPDSERKGG